MTMPFLDKVDGDNVEEVTGQVIPVHGASEKVPQGQMRRIVRGALSQLGRVCDPLPASASREVSPYAACGSIARDSFPRR